MAYITPRGYLLNLPEYILTAFPPPSRLHASRKTRVKLRPPAIVRLVIVSPPLKKNVIKSRESYLKRTYFKRNSHPVLILPLPRIRIPINDITLSGVGPLTQVNSDALYRHYIYLNDGRVYLEVFNNNIGIQSVTIESGALVDDLAVEDITVSIPAGATRLIGPFNVYTFNNLYTDNKVYINPSISVDLKFRAYRLP